MVGLHDGFFNVSGYLVMNVSVAIAPAAKAQIVMPKRGPLDGQRAGHARPPLVPPGMHHEREAIVRRHGDVEDPSTVLRNHRLGRRGMGHVPGAQHVEVDDVAVALWADGLGGAANWPPALLISTSTRPWRSSTPSKKRPPTPRRGMSTVAQSADPPASRMAAAVASMVLPPRATHHGGPKAAQLKC